MKKLLAALLLAPGLALASAGEVKLDRAPVDTDNIHSLQRGAKVFVNYCLNCHSAGYMRYNRLQDLDLSVQQIKDNLMFAADKVGETMNVAMRTEDAAKWFGVAPPDLTVIARSRRADWLYTYMRTFYRDSSRPTGWNNVVFQNASMPHVLYGVQGIRPLTVVEVKETIDEKSGASAGYERRTSVYDLNGERQYKLEKLTGTNHHGSITYRWGEPIGGQLSTAQYDALVADLVNYLVYMGEPAGNSRVQIGIYTMLFLVLLILVSWLLKREYWKDVH